MSGGSWFSRLFQGSTEEVGRRQEDLADLVGYPGLRLQRHSAGGDLVSEPRLVWEGAEDPRQGLRAQILAWPELTFTDVLLVLSPADFLRATATGGVPWLVRLQEELGEAYADLRRGHPHLPERRMRVRMARDGSGDVGQQDFGLSAGEFVTGLVPQLYTGRSSRSTEQLVVHLNLPAIDGEYRRVGRLYDDQPCYTLGSHWLDSYGHPELERPGLFRIFRDPDGQPVYELRPDLEGRYAVEVSEQQGVMVLTLTRGGQALAHLVLELVAGAEVEQDYQAEAAQRMRLSQPIEAIRVRLEAAGVSAAQASQERRPNAQIDSVILFEDRAVVTRSRFVKLTEGANEVRFEGLLPSLGSRHLEAEVRRGRARVLEVKTLSGTQAKARARGVVLREAKGILEALDELTERIAELLRQRATVGRTVFQGDLESSHLGSVTGVHGRLASMRGAERRLDEAIAEALERAASLDDQLAPLLRELDKPAPAGQVAVVTLSCSREGSVELALRYPVESARWSPRYRARLRTSTGRLELECMADLHQATGEDWQGVKLFLSPTLGGQRVAPLPVIPWTLEEGPALAELLAAQPEASLTVMSRGDGPAGDADLVEVPDRVSLGDGEDVRVLVGDFRAQTARFGRTVPRVEAKVYRMARIDAWSGPRLPEGPVACFLDEQFVGTGRLAALNPGEANVLGFGVDPELRTERLLMRREQREGTPGQAVHAFHYRIYVHSRAKVAVPVELVEQLPVGGPSVRLERAVASDGVKPELDPRLGLLTWQLTVGAEGVVLADTRFALAVRIGL
ncbi:MAG: DUF4139 domain-containing protein [Alphaproteobacteria bacterium]|nr:DUF4139 domain-containing protein [Alphaproteobacteria bacterium]